MKNKSELCFLSETSTRIFPIIFTAEAAASPIKNRVCFRKVLLMVSGWVGEWVNGCGTEWKSFEVIQLLFCSPSTNYKASWTKINSKRKHIFAELTYFINYIRRLRGIFHECFCKHGKLAKTITFRTMQINLEIDYYTQLAVSLSTVTVWKQT